MIESIGGKNNKEQEFPIPKRIPSPGKFLVFGVVCH
jgi:hypothetical protein